MKAVILTIVGLILILLVSYISISDKSNSFAFKTFVVGGDEGGIETDNMKTFVIEQEPTGRGMLIRTIKETQAARERNLRYEEMEGEIDKCIDKITKNWKRTYFKKSYEKTWGKIDPLYSDKEGWITTNEFWEKEKEFHGYDKDEDWDLRWRLRNRDLEGKSIC